MPFRSNFAPQTVAPVLQERNPTNIVSMVSSNQSIKKTATSQDLRTYGIITDEE